MLSKYDLTNSMCHDKIIKNDKFIEVIYIEDIRMNLRLMVEVHVLESHFM